MLEVREQRLTWQRLIPGKERRMVRKIGSFSVAAAVAVASAACMGPKGDWMYPHREMETMGETGDEHEHRVHRALEQDRRALAEDLDVLFMTDRPTRLTRWHSR